MTKQKIHYFHGDRTPEGLYYCRRCDSFESRNHFVAANEAAGGASGREHPCDHKNDTTR